MTSAIELDCSLILGDISHMVPPSLTRVSRFSTQNVTEDSVQHSKYGRLVSDVVLLRDRRVEITNLESAAIDSMMSMTEIRETKLGNGETELIETPDTVHVLKLSSWIMRHLAIFNAPPSEQLANTSVHVITEFMKKLDCPPLHLFPSGQSKQLVWLDELFLTGKEEVVT